MKASTLNHNELICPKCGGHDFIRWYWRHPLVIHWLLNPGLCINELLLGQRLPRQTVICQTCNKPLAERSFVPCPNCGTMHDARKWGKRNALAHWFGYVCPTCGAQIPCLWNVWSLLILIVTAPLWYLPSRLIKPKYLEFEKRRLLNAQPRAKTVRGKSWVRVGILAWGPLTWALFSAFMIAMGAHWTIVFTLPLWLAGGALWGALMERFMGSRPKGFEG